jgi:hypothetical protein
MKQWPDEAAIVAGQIADYCMQRGMKSVAERLLLETARLQLPVFPEARRDYLARTFTDKVSALKKLLDLHGRYNGIASLADLLRAEQDCL